MQTWQHLYDPLGKLWLSSPSAAIPVCSSFLALAHLRTRWHAARTRTVAPVFLSLTHALKS